MAIIVEDGTAKPDAEALASVAAFKAYCDARGVSYSAWSDAKIEQMLRRGSDYLSQAYRLRWAGYRVKDTQALDWPRYMVPKKDSPAGFGNYPTYYDFQSVPAEVVSANIEMAIRAAAGDLNADLGANVVVQTVGPISRTFDKATPQYIRYRAIDMLLEPFLTYEGGIKLIRA